MNIPPPSIPDPLDDATRALFKPEGDLSFGFPVDDGVMTWWRDKLGCRGLYPRELAAALGGGTERRCAFRFTEFNPTLEHLRLETRGFDGEVQVFFSGRSLEFDRGVIHLNKTSVETGYRGERIGTILLANAYELAVKLGFERLELLAAMDGTCVWARAGFLIADETWLPDNAERLRGPVRQRIYGLPRSEVDQQTQGLLLRLIEQQRPDMLWDLVDVPGKVMSNKPPARTELSWALLAETEARWYGYLPVGPGEPRDRLLDYLRKKAAI